MDVNSYCASLLTFRFKNLSVFVHILLCSDQGGSVIRGICDLVEMKRNLREKMQTFAQVGYKISRQTIVGIGVSQVRAAPHSDPVSILRYRVGQVDSHLNARHGPGDC